MYSKVDDLPRLGIDHSFNEEGTVAMSGQKTIHRKLSDELVHSFLRGRGKVRPRLQVGKTIFLAMPPKPAAQVEERYNGTATDVMLQGFHWTSSASENPNWYQILAQNAGVIKAGLFDLVWFPPPSASADHEGYMPTLWNDLNSEYGTQDDLTVAIAALKPVRALADVVVNHRCGQFTGGGDFAQPAFALADQTFAITRGDECKVGKGNADTGENQEAARDLDHTNPVIKSAIIAYEQMLQKTGFSALRYDEARGYWGSFVGEFNDATDPYLSVGEFWDSDTQNVIDWIDSTGGKSMAFDFPTRTFLQQAVTQSQFGLLKTIDGRPTGGLRFWSSMCVTFVDDHDTAPDHPDAQGFGDGDQVLQAYAYILTHPGIPCVFWTHYFDWGAMIQLKIQNLIALRKKAAINSGSIVNIVAADDGKYAAIIDNKVALKLGPAPWDPGAGWSVAVDGNDFAVWTPTA